MSARELIILLLGLAILAIVLRGLYVAIQTRRGHIRLAIDKNIPADIDLDKLELSELPSGGARVKSRAGEAGADGVTPQFRLDRAQARAAAMDLEEDGEQIPVLMEAVNLRAKTTAPEANEDEDWEPEESFAATPGAQRRGRAHTEDAYAEDTHTEDPQAQTRATETDVPEEINEDLFADEEADPNERLFRNADQFVDEDEDDSEDEYAASAQDEDEDNDDILLDYDLNESAESAADEDPMASVRPDYEEPELDEDDFDEEAATQSRYDDDEFDDDREDVAAFDSDQDRDNELNEDDDLAGETPPAEEQPARPAAPRFEDSLDEFSLSAGERIGGYERRKPQSQAALFDTNDDGYDDGPGDGFDDYDDEPDVAAETPRRAAKEKSRKRAGLGQSLLSALRRSRKPDAVVAEESPPGKDRREASSRIPQPEPLATPGLEASNEELSPEIPETPRRKAQPSRQAQPEPKPRDTAPAPPSDVLVINVMARENRVFRGDDLLEALITSGLKFGDMQIFHKRLRGDSKGPIIFSVANILNPGVFDLNSMDEFQTVGISLFLGLPAPISSQEAFNLMLDTAQHLKTQLDGEMRDDSRNVMTGQTIEHYRERIREIDLRQLKAAGARG